MAVPILYVETSVWGCLAPKQPTNRARVVRRLLSWLDGSRALCAISDVVVEEIDLAPDAEAAAIRHRLDALQPLARPVTEAVRALAQGYIDARVLPERRVADAIHVAAATCFGADYLVSWNHRHMTRPKKKLQYAAVSLLHGYLKTPLICNPVEACDELREG